MGIDGIEPSSGTAHYSFMPMCRGEVPVEDFVQGMPFWKKPFARLRLNKLVGKHPMEDGYHLDVARSVKAVVGSAPVFLVGGMRKLDHMEDVVSKGYADFISMSRPFIKEPYLVNRFRQGNPTERLVCRATNVWLRLSEGRQYVASSGKVEGPVTHFMQ